MNKKLSWIFLFVGMVLLAVPLDNDISVAIKILCYFMGMGFFSLGLGLDEESK